MRWQQLKLLCNLLCQSATLINTFSLASTAKLLQMQSEKWFDRVFYWKTPTMTHCMIKIHFFLWLLLERGSVQFTVLRIEYIVDFFFHFYLATTYLSNLLLQFMNYNDLGLKIIPQCYLNRGLFCSFRIPIYLPEVHVSLKQWSICSFWIPIYLPEVQYGIIVS